MAIDVIVRDAPLMVLNAVSSSGAVAMIGFSVSVLGEKLTAVVETFR
jgi:hypothetical protein